VFARWTANLDTARRHECASWLRPYSPVGARLRREVVQTRFGKAAIVRSREPPLDDMNLFSTGADAPVDWRV
jgi:hypothetical protein